MLECWMLLMQYLKLYHIRCRKRIILVGIIMLLTVLRTSAEYIPSTIDTDRTLKDASVNWDVKHKQSFYLKSHQISETDVEMETILGVEAIVPSTPSALFTRGELSVHYPSTTRDNKFILQALYWDTTAELPCIFSSANYLSLRLGIQTFAWGNSVMYNPTDNLSPWYSVAPFDSRRIGLLAGKVSFASDLHFLDVIYIPTFKPTELPPLGDRFFIYSPPSGPNPFYPKLGPPQVQYRYTETLNTRKPEDDESPHQVAIRYSGTLKEWDVVLSWFNGYENIPLFEAIPVRYVPEDNAVDLKVQYLYAREQVFGIELTRVFGKLGTHAEAAYFNMEKTGHNIGIGDKDYTVAVIGAEYTLHDVIGQQDITVSLEYTREFADNSDNRIYINRIYKNALLSRISHVVDYKLSGELRYAYDFQTHGAYIRCSYEYQYSDHVRLQAGVEIFNGPNDSYFGQYDANDNLFITASVLF